VCRCGGRKLVVESGEWVVNGFHFGVEGVMFNVTLNLGL